jgi:hypothetical protein
LTGPNSRPINFPYFKFNQSKIKQNLPIDLVFRIGRDDLLGCCVLGAESPTMEGREQWRECFSLPTPNQLCPPDRAHRNQLGVSEAVGTRKPRSVGKWHSILAEVPEDFRHITKAKK